MAKDKVKTKKKTGPKHPSKYTEENRKRIKELLELGLNYKDVCLSTGITTETFHEWRKKYPEFSALVDAANVKVKEIALKSLRIGEMKDWKAAAWRLERRWPDEYKEKREVELTKPILIDNMFNEDEDEGEKK